MPSLPEALSHGHTLAKPARRTDSTFCDICKAWFERKPAEKQFCNDPRHSKPCPLPERCEGCKVECDPQYWA